jgi:hypothetical protein
MSRNPTIEKRGRPLLGQKAMTAAERQRRHRAKVKPLRRRKAVWDWALVKPIGGAAWQECCRKTPRLEVPPIEVCDAHAQWVSEVVQTLGRRPLGSILGNTQAPMRQLLRHLPALLERFRGGEERGALPSDHPHVRRIVACKLIESETRFLLGRYADDGASDWTDLAGPICACAMGDGRHSVSHANDPLCTFVRLVLEEMGIPRSLHDVSMALRGRRGRRAREKKADKNPAL